MGTGNGLIKTFNIKISSFYPIFLLCLFLIPTKQLLANTHNINLVEYGSIIIPDVEDQENFTDLAYSKHLIWPQVSATISGKVTLHNVKNNVHSLVLDLNEQEKIDFLTDGKTLGLYALTLHPNFSKQDENGEGVFYTAHTEKNTAINSNTNILGLDPDKEVHHYDVISEWRITNLNEAPDVFEPSREILRVARYAENEYVVDLKFRPYDHSWDAEFGYLYIGFSSTNTLITELTLEQSHSNLNGTILRIKPDKFGLKQYTVPENNPFTKSNQHLPEVYLWGLNNLQGFSWDISGKKHLIIADSIEAKVQEINIGEQGANYGSGLMNGVELLEQDNLIKSNKIKRQLYLPATAYSTNIGTQIIPGAVYRGNSVPQLVGFYIFADKKSDSLLYAPSRQLNHGQQARVSKLAIGGIEKLSITANTLPLHINNMPSGDIYIFDPNNAKLYTLSSPSNNVTKSTAQSNSTNDQAADTEEGMSPTTIIIGFMILGISAIVIFSSPKGIGRKVLKELRSSYVQISWDKNSKVISFLKRKESDASKTLPISELEKITCYLNQDVLCEISAVVEHGMSADIEKHIRDVLHEEHIHKMVPGKVRQLTIDFDTVKSDTISVNLYMRKGGQRLTRTSYEKCTDEIIEWCWLASEYLNPENTGKKISVESKKADKTRTVKTPGPAIKPTIYTPVNSQPIAVESKSVNTSSVTPSASVVDDLQNLVKLKEQGLISDEEFNLAKSKLLKS